MAELKQYGYYIKGHNIALVERDTTFDNDLNSKDFGPGSDRAQWKSPLSSITDGIELEYVYSPTYRITSTTTQGIDNYRSNNGLLRLTLSDASTFAKGAYILISGSADFNGLHTVNTASDNSTTLILDTKYTGGVIGDSTTVSTIKVNPNVDVLNNEDDLIDLPEYLCKALVDYVKAKLAEDQLNMEIKEYYMREFRRKVEKFNNTRVATMRVVAPGTHSIT